MRRRIPLALLRDFGRPDWKLEGIDSGARAVEAAARNQILVHHGLLHEAPLPESAYDMVLLIAPIEHVDDAPGLLARTRQLLKPGGRFVIVTDNTASFNFPLFQGRHWGGYHFPGHWYLFNPRNLRRLAEKAGFEVRSLDTLVSPVTGYTQFAMCLWISTRPPGWWSRSV